MGGVCENPGGSWRNADGSLNDCIVDIYLQAALAALAVVGVALGFLVAKSSPRTSHIGSVTGVDKARMALIVFLFVVDLVLLLCGVTSAAEATAAEGFGAGLRAFGVLALALWQQYEVQRGLPEATSPKLWWFIALLARVPVVYATAVPSMRVVPFVLALIEVLIAAACVAVYMVSAGRSVDRVPLLDDGAPVFERTVSTREPSPEANIGLLGFLTFTWFTPIVDLAQRRDTEGSKLEPADVYRLCEKDLPRRQLQRLESEWEVELRKPQPSLGAAMRRAFQWEVLGTAWIKLLNDLLHFVGPFLLNRILRLIKDAGGDSSKDYSEAYVYAIGMVFSSAVQAFLMAHYFQQGYRTGMRLRCSLILMAYQKALKVLPWPTPPPPQPPAPADEPRRRCFRRTARPKPPSPTVGGMGQMTNLISADTDKFTFLMPYFNLIWSAPFQLIICFIMLVSYVSWALLAGMVVMFGFMWLSGVVQNKARKIQAEAMKAKDERLKTQVELLKIVKIIKLYAWETTIEDRVRELRHKEMALQLRYKLWSMGMFLSFSLSPMLVALSTFTCYTVVLGKELDAATAFTSLSLFNILTFPLGALPMMARFFMEAAVAKDRLEAFYLAPEVAPKPGPPQNAQVAVDLNASMLKWPDGTELLKNVKLSVSQGEFVAIVGRTGVGKSGMLYAMLGELPIPAETGKVAVRGTTGYCAQTAWVRNTTLRDNITGGTQSRGSDMDERYEQVLDACALRQDLEALPDGDQTMIGDRGINLSGGQKQRVAIARAVYANPDVYILDDVLSALDAHVASHICNNLFAGPLMQGKTIVLVTHSTRALPRANRVVVIGADKDIVFTGPYDEFRSKGLMEELEEADATPSSPGSPSTAEEGAGVNADKTGKSPAKTPPANKPKPTGQEERRSGAVTWAVYRAYAAACGGFLPVAGFFVVLALSESSRNLADVWLTKWSDSGGSAAGAAVYAACSLFGVATGLMYATARIFLGQAGSRRLHEKCVNSLLRATMSFFDLTPTGQILNRLAEDTNILDYNLPQTMAANLVWIWRSVSIIVFCMMVGWYLVFLILPMFVLYGRLARRYLPATRDLRRLDAASRSPIFSHFAETMGGVSTVRAMQIQDDMMNAKIGKLESQMEAYYLSNTAARWLSLRLQFNGTILVGAVSTLGIATAASGRVSSGVVGVAITYALKLTDTLNQVNRESADRETQMVAVERVHHYTTSVPREAALQVPGQAVPAGWPSQGEIRMENVSMRYRDGLPLVLNDLNVHIKPGERIGVVGRTGCGKSSLLLTLMRLVEPTNGRVFVDAVDVGSIGLHTLREKAAIIPQDPAILTGTVRFNLDPFNLKPEKDLWDALEKAQLKPRVQGAEGGLDSKVEEGGGNYSVGELQLLCLARALLRRQEIGGLLLLDEATSALDGETDNIIQQVIRKDFHCTTITIAHRIQTLMDYDRVLVLSEGRVAEFDSPQTLLQKDGEFKALAREAGISGAM